MGSAKATVAVIGATLGVLGFGCGDDGGSGAQGGAGGQGGAPGTGGSTADAGSGGTTSSATATGATTGSTTGPSAVAATTGAGGAMAFACDPPAAPGSFYAEEAWSYDVTILEPVSMCEYRGDVLLVVNTAAL